MKLSTVVSERGPFWRRTPVRGPDVVGLYFLGVSSLAAGNGTGALRAGWALWTLGGLHRYRSRDLLTDGYDLWSPTVDPVQRLRFAKDAFQRACAETPTPLLGDLRHVPSAAVMPTAAIYGFRCWSGLRIIGALKELGDDIGRRRAHHALQAALIDCHSDLLTPEAQAYFDATT